MRRLLFILVVQVAGLAALGYYRGWFSVSDSAVTVDKEKVKGRNRSSAGRSLCGWMARQRSGDCHEAFVG
jgi:hypothetical protein